MKKTGRRSSQSSRNTSRGEGAGRGAPPNASAKHDWPSQATYMHALLAALGMLLCAGLFEAARDTNHRWLLPSLCFGILALDDPAADPGAGVRATRTRRARAARRRAQRHGGVSDLP